MKRKWCKIVAKLEKKAMSISTYIGRSLMSPKFKIQIGSHKLKIKLDLLWGRKSFQRVRDFSNQNSLNLKG
jgi:hypothetical protein